MALPTKLAKFCWAQAEQILANAIADCPGTLEFLCVGTIEAAKQGNMHIDVLPPPEDGESYRVVVDGNTGESEWSQLYPFILLGTPGDEVGAASLFRRSSPNDFGVRGVVQVVFAALPDVTLPLPDQQRVFKDQVFRILEELTDRGDMSGFLHFDEIILQGFFRERPDHSEDVGEVQRAECFVSWGDTEE